MSKKTLRCVTRKSRLALWQANHVKEALEAHYPDLSVELIGLSTEGDRNQAPNLAAIGGKSLFVKELEWALLAGQGDFAVHSLKDMSACLSPEFQIAAFCSRENPQDVLVSTRYHSLNELPPNLRIGSSSIRRRMQCQALFPDMTCLPLRGNVDTRLKKLEDGHYDAIVLAHAGLIRLGLTGAILHEFSPEEMLPPIGQGILALECLASNAELADRLSILNDTVTAACARAERAMNAQLGGGCHVPIAAYAQPHAAGLLLRAQLWSNQGNAIIASAQGPLAEAERLGAQVAQDLFAQGAELIMAQWSSDVNGPSGSTDAN